MNARGRPWAAAASLLTTMLLACGGGSGASRGPLPTSSAVPGGNVQAIVVSSGPTGQFPNTVLTSVTICVPGTTNCQTIPDVQVDTGSSGLRLLASVITLPLNPVTSPGSGQPYSECAGFADGVVWGRLARADVVLAGESAPSVPLQVIQDNGFGPGIPVDCSGQGTLLDSLVLLGTNGILGVGPFLQDCGDFCASNTGAIYYDCSDAGGCTQATVAVVDQVSNPAAFFAQDNNGVILQLPTIPTNGAVEADGNMIFGIGTQSNNALAAPAIGVADSGPTAGSFSAIYRGATLTNSFFDSGSTGLYFDDASLPTCSSTSPVGDLSAFYCPGPVTTLSSVPISVTIVGSNGTSDFVSASVGNAQFLFTQPGAASLNAFDDLAGPAGPTLPNALDFGVPVFFGRSVFTAFEQRPTPAGAGPYFAVQPLP